MNCCLCNKEIEEIQIQNEYPFCGNFRYVCDDCRKAINYRVSLSKKEKMMGKEYFSNLLESNQYDPDILFELKKIVGLPISSEEKIAAKKFAKDCIKAEKEKDKAEYQSQVGTEKKYNGIGFVVAGVIFLIIAVFLFVDSNKLLDRKSSEVLGIKAVANIQETVFSAASFIASVICFACRNVIINLKRKNE